MSTRPTAETKRIRAAFAAATAGMPRSRRHPAEVTSDRLGDAVSHWGDLLDGKELDALALVRQALEEIADGTRKSTPGVAGLDQPGNDLSLRVLACVQPGVSGTPDGGWPTVLRSAAAAGQPGVAPGTGR